MHVRSLEREAWRLVAALAPYCFRLYALLSRLGWAAPPDLGSPQVQWPLIYVRKGFGALSVHRRGWMEAEQGG